MSKRYRVVKSRDFEQERILNSYSEQGFTLEHIRDLNGHNDNVVEYTFSIEVNDEKAQD